MAQYVDYNFYSGEYGGSAVASDQFKLQAVKASAFIDQVTFERAGPIVTAGTDTDTILKIKLATCAVIDEQSLINDTGGVIASESIGSHSVSYSQKHLKSEKKRLTEAAKLFLGDTGLMYRGFYADEYGSNRLSEISEL